MDHLERIRILYRNFKGDSIDLFQEILQISDEIGLEDALGLLERCVFEKRREWIQQHLTDIKTDGQPVQAGYHWFYEEYLHVSLPKDGELVSSSRDRIVTRWWNPCPTLDACQKLGLDTRVVCRLAYHRPVDEFLKAVHPGLRFERNYDCIRPYTGYCEEMVIVDMPGINPDRG
jgi:hypothetical protein